MTLKTHILKWNVWGKFTRYKSLTATFTSVHPSPHPHPPLRCLLQNYTTVLDKVQWIQMSTFHPSDSLPKNRFFFLFFLQSAKKNLFHVNLNLTIFWGIKLYMCVLHMYKLSHYKQLDIIISWILCYYLNLC